MMKETNRADTKPTSGDIVTNWICLAEERVPERLDSTNYYNLLADAYDVADMATVDTMDLMAVVKEEMEQLNTGYPDDIARVQSIISVAMHNMQRHMARLMRMKTALTLEIEARAHERWNEDIPHQSAISWDSEAVKCLSNLQSWDQKRLAS